MDESAGVLSVATQTKKTLKPRYAKNAAPRARSPAASRSMTSRTAANLTRVKYCVK